MEKFVLVSGAWFALPASYALGLSPKVAFGYAMGVTFSMMWVHLTTARKGGDA